MKKIQKALRNPLKALHYLYIRFRGECCRCWYILFNRRVSIGKGFKLEGKLRIKGPGKVIIGDYVYVNGSGTPVTPFTHSKEAVLSIGDHSFINGTKFGCCKEIRISERAILANCSIMDTDFHSIQKDRWSESSPVKVKPVILERNVWVAGSAAILKGVHVGENSVIGFGAIVTSNVPSNSLVAGNPAVVVRSITE